jgi:hypothetical protein
MEDEAGVNLCMADNQETVAKSRLDERELESTAHDGRAPRIHVWSEVRSHTAAHMGRTSNDAGGQSQRSAPNAADRHIGKHH